MPKITVYDHQQMVSLAPDLISKLQSAATTALPMVMERCACRESPLFNLEEIEISLIDDATIADVHQRFMGIPGATDVITFDHGEIHISLETALRQAEEFFHDSDAEIMLYIIHGLLHLAGHEDATDRGLETMDLHQTELLRVVWQG
ncbi:MAG: rRNA maturation RNase YbeY [Akkermansiaceae bacterium]